MEKGKDDEKQWQKIKDTEYIGMIPLGLGFSTAAINSPRTIGLIMFGVFWIIIGLVQMKSWDTYYHHRPSLLKWLIIILIVLMMVQVILFFNSILPLPYKSLALGVNILLETIIIFLAFKRRSKINSLKINSDK